MLAPLGNCLSYNVFLADVVLRDALNPGACGFRNLRRIVPELVTQRGCELRIIKNADAVRPEK